MRNFVITLPESPKRTESCKQHLRERRVYDITWFYGWHAEKMGLKTVWPYEVDNPGSGFNMGFKPTGIWCSHYALFQALNLLWDEHFLIMEDDVQVPEDWHTRMTSALGDVPRDFDCLYVGNCCTAGKPKTHIKGEVFEVKYPLCTHAIIWAKKALPFVIETLRQKVYAPVDLALSFHVLPHLKCYTVLPRIFSQFDTVIPD